MPIKAGIGFSKEGNPKDAINEAYKMAIKGDSKFNANFALLFASPSKYDQESLLIHLKNKTPHAVIVGCSTSGEITNFGSKDRSIALMLIQSETSEFIAGVGHNIKADPRAAGRNCAKSIIEQSKGRLPKAVIMLPDGLSGNGADIVRGILDVFGKDIKLAGGAAGDDFLFEKTYQYYDSKVYSGSVVAVGIFGDIDIGIGVRHGWIPIGNPRTVTKSESNIVYELDNKPAIEMYEDQFGKDRPVIKKDEPFAKLAITYPLGIEIPGKEEYLIRDPLTVDTLGAITCAAEIPQGSKVSIMIGSREEAIQAAKEAASMAMSQVNNKPSAVLLFNCIARKKILMNKRQDEIDTISRVIGLNTPLIGFYTYGEQAPLGEEIATCSFHNETDVIVALS